MNDELAKLIDEWEGPPRSEIKGVFDAFFGTEAVKRTALVTRFAVERPADPQPHDRPMTAPLAKEWVRLWAVELVVTRGKDTMRAQFAHEDPLVAFHAARRSLSEIVS